METQTLIGCLLSESNIVTLEYVSKSLSQSIKLLGYEAVNIFELEITNNNDLVQSDLILFKINRHSTFEATDLLMMEFYNKYYLPIRLETKRQGNSKIIMATINPRELPIQRSQLEILAAQKVAIPLVSFGAANNFEYNECEDEFVIDPKNMFWQQGENLEGRLPSSPAWFDHLFLRTGRSGHAITPITFYSQQTSLQYVRYRSINFLPLPRLTPEERLKEITMKRPDLLPLHEVRQEDRQRNRGMLAIQNMDYQDSRRTSPWPVASNHHDTRSAPEYLMTQEAQGFYVPDYEDVRPDQQLYQQHPQYQQQQHPQFQQPQPHLLQNQQPQFQQQQQHQTQQQQFQQQQQHPPPQQLQRQNPSGSIEVITIPSEVADSAPQAPSHQRSTRREGPLTTEEQLIYSNPFFKEVLKVVNEKIHNMQPEDTTMQSQSADKSNPAATLSPERRKNTSAETSETAGLESQSAEASAGDGAAEVLLSQQLANPSGRPPPDQFDVNGRVNTDYVWHVSTVTGLNLHHIYEDVRRTVAPGSGSNLQTGEGQGEKAAPTGAPGVPGSQSDSWTQNHGVREVSRSDRREGMHLRGLQPNSGNQQEHDSLHGGVQTQASNNYFQRPEAAANVQPNQYQGGGLGPGGSQHPRPAGRAGPHVPQQPQQYQPGNQRGAGRPMGAGRDPPYMVGGKFLQYNEFRESVNRGGIGQLEFQQGGHFIHQPNRGGQQFHNIYQQTRFMGSQGRGEPGRGDRNQAGDARGGHHGGRGGSHNNQGGRGFDGRPLQPDHQPGGGDGHSSVSAARVANPVSHSDNGDRGTSKPPDNTSTEREKNDQDEGGKDEEDEKREEADKTPVTKEATAEEKSGSDGGQAENRDGCNQKDDGNIQEEKGERREEAGDKNGTADAVSKKQIREKSGPESKEGTSRIKKGNSKGAKRDGQDAVDQRKSAGDSDSQDDAVKEQERTDKRESDTKQDHLPERSEDIGASTGNQESFKPGDRVVDVMAKVHNTEGAHIDANRMGPKISAIVDIWESRSQLENAKSPETAGDNSKNAKGPVSRELDGHGDYEEGSGGADDYEDVEVTKVSPKSNETKISPEKLPGMFHDHHVPISSANVIIPPRSDHDSLKIELEKVEAFTVPRHNILSSSIDSLDLELDDNSGHFYQSALRRSVRHLVDHVKDDEAPPLIQTAMFSLLSDADCKRFVKQMDEAEQEAMSTFITDIYDLTNDVRTAISELRSLIKDPNATHESIWEGLNALGQLSDSCGHREQILSEMFMSSTFAKAVQDWIDRLSDTLTEESREALAVLVKFHSTPEQIVELSKSRFADETLECARRRRESIHIAAGLTLEVNDSRVAVSAPASPGAELSQQFSRLRLDRHDNSGINASNIHLPQNVFGSPVPCSPIGPQHMRRRLTSTPAVFDQTDNNRKSNLSKFSSAKSSSSSVSSSGIPNWIRGLFMTGVNSHITGRGASSEHENSPEPAYSLRQTKYRVQRQAAQERGQSSSSSRSREDRGTGGRGTEQRGLLSKITNLTNQGTKGRQRYNGKKGRKGKK